MVKTNGKMSDKIRAYFANDTYSQVEQKQLQLNKKEYSEENTVKGSCDDVNAQYLSKKQQAREMIKSKFDCVGNSNLYVDFLLDLIDEKVANRYFSIGEAENVFDAIGGSNSHISLRTTKGLDEIFLMLVEYFNPNVDYYISNTAQNVIRMNIKENKFDSLAQYSIDDLRALKGPFVYTTFEMSQILHEIQEAEKGMSTNWNDMQKFVYLQNYIVSTIKYNTFWQNTLEVRVPPYNSLKTRVDNNSLRGLITKQTICLGYSVILGEFLNRQNIENYINVNSKHAYNVVKLGEKFYLVDLVSEGARLAYTGQFDKPMWIGKEVNDFFRDDKRKFEINLIPNQPNPQFSLLNAQVYQDTLAEVLKRRIYDRLSFDFEQDNQEVNVTQIEPIDINGREYFRYLHQSMPYVQNLPVLIFCRNNLAEFVYRKNNNQTIDPMLEKGIMSILDKTNVEDATKNYHGDVGSVYLTSDGSRIRGVERIGRDTQQMDNRIGAYRREDGANIVLIPCDIKNSVIEGKSVKMYPYEVYVGKLVGDILKYRGYTIFSEQNFGIYESKEQKECFFNTMLSDDALLSSVRDFRGYIGAIDMVGNEARYKRTETIKNHFTSNQKALTK
ncbi:MAG: hypothetical protein IKQ31_01000 [Clostridia bacterium]|nr:hypothetical protein [Clostridia bacterium]